MNLSSVQELGAARPWRRAAPLLYPVEVGRETAVVAVAVFSLDVAVRLQIGNGPLDRAFGEPKINCDSPDARPAFALGGGHALEVHVDCLGPVRNTVVSVDCVKKADSITSLYYREVVFATQFEFMCYTVEDAVDWLSPPTA